MGISPDSHEAIAWPIAAGFSAQGLPGALIATFF